MLRHLVNKALQDVWCSPRQDNLHILQLHKLTATYGALGVVSLAGRDVNLPDTSKRYHVYQIGQLSPAYLGLLAIKPSWLPERWTTFSKAINTNNVQVDIYTETGVMFPRFKSHYMLTSSRTLIVAIEISPKIPANLDDEIPFIRFYKNAIFSTVAGSATGEHLLHYGEVITSGADIIRIANQIASYKNKNGSISCWVNGVTIDAIDSFNVKINDIVEFLYDSTMFRIVTLAATDNKVFVSKLDKTLKYILHYKKDKDSNIYYQDDVDIEVVYVASGNRFRGRYYNKNVYSCMRMLTHRDYSIPVDNVMRIITDIQRRDPTAPKELSSYRIRLKIKTANRLRPLIYDANRIFELYKLPEDKLLRAMEGLDSTLEEWKATNLESSPYVRLMDTPIDNITMKEVQEAYGYNGAATVLANNPTATYTNSSRLMAKVPMGYRINSAGYEYDKDGLYLANSYNNVNDDYYAVDPKAKSIEYIVGKPLPHNKDIFGSDDLPIPRFDYRVYMTYIKDGKIDDAKWRDVTSTPHYDVVNGKLKWNNLEVDHILCLRDDTTFYARDYKVKEEFGMFRVRLLEFINGVDVDMKILRGDIDVFLNGSSLIHGLDYEIKLPYLYINNTKYLKRPLKDTTQNVHVRMAGFCEKDLKPAIADEIGFIRHGLLSENDRFNLRDDRVIRLIVDGKYLSKSSVIFAEDSSAISVINAKNGLPYQVKDFIIPIRDLVDENSYSYKAKAEVMDKKVSDYLTEHMPAVDRGILSAIGTRYNVSSPFLSRIVYRLLSDQIKDNDIAAAAGDMWIVATVEEDKYLLDSDPISEDKLLPTENVAVTPHRYNNLITLSILKYRFLNRVIQLYSKAPIELSQFVLINKEL